LVLGAGNTAIGAALAAHEQAPTVVVVEKAPFEDAQRVTKLETKGP
jgi:succinate dehydrogenase/fumarate reductase flavoprotein subunit